MVALQSLSLEQRQQVFDFVEFLALKANHLTDHPTVASDALDSSTQNWVEAASGSMKDLPEFDSAVAYGTAIRQDNASDAVAKVSELRIQDWTVATG